MPWQTLGICRRWTIATTSYVDCQQRNSIVFRQFRTAALLAGRVVTELRKKQSKRIWRVSNNPLHWLPIAERIQCKVLYTVYKGSAPFHLSELIPRYTLTRSLWPVLRVPPCLSKSPRGNATAFQELSSHMRMLCV